ncbi:MAG TPA: hypothetical protein VF742_04830, partial [Terracidiphilus sp.]
MVQAQPGAAEEEPDALEAVVVCVAPAGRWAEDSTDAPALDCWLAAQPDDSFPDGPVPDDCRVVM